VVPGDYVPDPDTVFDNNLFYLFPNTCIEYKTSVYGGDVVFHLELNGNKLGKDKRPVKKNQIHILNRSVLDTINNPNFYPNQIVPPRIPSRGMYDRLN
jgi:hypothetical protein